MQLPSVLFFSLIVALVSGDDWKRIGMGRPIWAAAVENHEHTKLLLLSKTATLSLIDPSSGNLEWRAVASTTTNSLHPIAAIVSANLVFIALSNFRVRAMDINSGSVSWEIPGCGVLFAQTKFAALKNCDTGLFFKADVSSGSVIPDDDSIAVGDKDTFEPLIMDPPLLEWNAGRTIIRSFPDGLVTGESHADGKEIWRKEESLAQPIAAAMYLNDKESILVVLTELATVLGLSSNSGKLLWKRKVPSKCSLLEGHHQHVVLVCTGSDSQMIVYDSANGDLVFEEVHKGFSAERFAADLNCHQSKSMCVRLYGIDGTEATLPIKKHAGFIETTSMWLKYKKGGSFVQGMKGPEELWKLQMPGNSVVLHVSTSKPPHHGTSMLRPPAVRVTGDRRVLFKYVSSDVALILAHDEGSKETFAMLIDTTTGTLHDIVSHPDTAPPISAARGDSWFVYATWNQLMMSQEVHVLDLYNQPANASWVKESMMSSVRVALRKNGIASAIHNSADVCPVSLEDEDDVGSCDVQEEHPANPFLKADGAPYVVRSSALFAKRISTLEITQTKMGLIEPSVIFALESGQVALVSKFLLDARRPKEMNDAYMAEYLLPYQPIYSLKSNSRESTFLDNGKHVPCISSIVVAPDSARESSCHVVVVGLDLLYNLVKPAGNFDTIPKDFFYAGVIGMLGALLASCLFAQRLKSKSDLTSSWEGI